MKAVFCLLLLLQLWFVYGLSDSDRVHKLQSVAKGKKNGLLSLSVETFKKYVEAAPRSYSLFVLFTADSKNCASCATMKTVLSKLALEYSKLPPSRQARNPVFFAELKIRHEDVPSMKIYDLTHVPLLYHFGPGSSRKYPAPIRDGSDYYDAESHGIGPSMLKSFVNKRTGSKMIIGGYAIPFLPIVKERRMFIAGVAGLLVAVIVVKQLYLKPYFWFACVMAVYMFSLGGGHYTWIQNVPWAVVSEDGTTQYIAGGSRNQYVAEALFTSALCVIISVLIILLRELPSITQKMPYSVRGEIFQRLLGCILVSFLFLSASTLLSLYQHKMPGYLGYSEM